MSFAMTDAVVRDHMQDVRHQVARGRGRSPQPSPLHDQSSAQFHGQPEPRHAPARLTWLRSQVGYRLIEAGLHLLADAPQPRG